MLMIIKCIGVLILLILLVAIIAIFVICVSGANVKKMLGEDYPHYHGSDRE